MTQSSFETGLAKSKRIIALIDDLFFAERIRATGIGTGIPIEILKSGEVLLQRIKTEIPSLLIVDLNGTSTGPIETIQKIKSDPRLGGFPILGFFSHVQEDLKRRALQAGCNTVLPRSSFSKDLSKILKEHSIQ